MMNKYAFILVLMFIPPTFVLTACGSGSANPSGKAIEGPSEKDFQGKTFSSDCLRADDPVTGAKSHYFVLDFFTRSFSYTDVWHMNENCKGNYSVAYSTSGTFALPANVPGNGTAGGFLTFNITSSDLMAASTSVQASVNADCGASSPFEGQTNAAENGAHKSTFDITCRNMDFPGDRNHSVLNSVVFNGEQLQVIMPYTGIPGQFSGKSLSGEPVTLH